MRKSTELISIIRENCNASRLRQFHNGSNLGAKFRKAPSTRAALRGATPTTATAPNMVRVRKDYDPEANLPPLVLLESGHKSGALPIEPHTALALLRRYQELSVKATQGWEKEVCTEFKTPPSTLVLLSKILNRSPSDGQRYLATKVMHSASELGDASATLQLISNAIKNKLLNQPSYAAPLRRLGILAKKEGDRQAMTLLGKVLLTQQKDKESLEWFRKATQGPTDLLNFEGAGEALVNEGRILQGWKDKGGARKAFQKAALELDDPSAYFYLSQLEEVGSSQQQVYLLKAASSGIVEAWHNLGSLELSRIEKKPEKPATIHDYGMAKEWFQVAATDGFGLSMLNLALIFRNVGQPDDGLKWLEKAEELPEVRDQARSMKAQWEETHIEIS